jgi:hypothetical protein
MLAWALRLWLPIALSAPEQAQAQVPGLTLTWNAPAGCPERADVEQSIQKLLGEGPERRTAALDARIDVWVAGEGRWQALVVTRGASAGTRRLAGGSCRSVALASAVVIAQAIQPGAEEPEPAPANVPRVERPKDAPPRAPAPRIVPFVSALGGGALGTLPGVAPELGLGLGLRRARWQGELRLSHAPSQSLAIAGTIGRAEIDRTALVLSGCFAIIATRANTSAVCLAAALERIFGQARGVVRPESHALLLLSPAAGLESATHLTDHWALVLSVRGVVRPYHPRFVIDGGRPVYPIPIVGGSLLGGLEFAF